MDFALVALLLFFVVWSGRRLHRQLSSFEKSSCEEVSDPPLTFVSAEKESTLLSSPVKEPKITITRQTIGDATYTQTFLDGWEKERRVKWILSPPPRAFSLHSRSRTNQTKSRKKGLDPSEHNRYHGGHIVGHKFGGSTEMVNMVPLSVKLNLSAFARLENEIASTSEKLEIDFFIQFISHSECPAFIDVSLLSATKTKEYKFVNESGLYINL